MREAASKYFAFSTLPKIIALRKKYLKPNDLRHYIELLALVVAVNLVNELNVTDTNQPIQLL